MDEFTVHLPKAQVKKLHVRHDNSGHGAAWFLDSISLQCQDAANRNNSMIFFPCFAWLKVNFRSTNNLAAQHTLQIYRHDALDGCLIRPGMVIRQPSTSSRAL